MTAPRLRFAPSPSGYLHIGGARTALFAWLWARKQGGRFIVRVEDTDQDRSSIESVRAILDALKWLGLDWDEGPEVDGPHSPYFQSERKQLYWDAAERLVAEGKAYRCYATKEELAAAREAFQKANPKGAFKYPGWWRDKSPEDWIEGAPYVVRFKVPTDGTVDFQDLVYGLVSTPNTEQQDFVIMRSNGLPLYNLACVVDDHAMGITTVARGADHIGNTPAQVMLYKALGWELPEFAHLPLMLDPKGGKMSKRNKGGDPVNVADYQERGYTPMGVLNYLARFGWSYGDQEIFSRDELLEFFDWERCGTSAGKYDAKKFLDVNYEQLRRQELTSDDQYVSWVLPFLEQRGINAPDAAVARKALPHIRERAHTLAEAADLMDYFFRDEPVVDEKASRKFLKPEAAPRLRGLADLLEAAPAWDPTALEARFREWIEAQQLKMKDIAQPARVALTGRSASPGLFDVMLILGKDVSLARLRAGADRAGSASAS